MGAAVTPGGTYNGRDCVDFAAVAGCLAREGHVAAARELDMLVSTAFAHVEGRVKEAEDGSGWVGYSSPEPLLAEAAQDVRTSARRRYGRVKEASTRGTDGTEVSTEAARKAAGGYTQEPLKNVPDEGECDSVRIQGAHVTP